MLLDMAIYNWKWQPGDFLKALAFFWILWNFINYYYFDYEKRICPRAVLRLLKDYIPPWKVAKISNFSVKTLSFFWWEVAGVMGSIYSSGKETSNISHSLSGFFCLPGVGAAVTNCSPPNIAHQGCSVQRGEGFGSPVPAQNWILQAGWDYL